MKYAIAVFAYIAFVAAAPGHAVEGDWIFKRGRFSHNPVTGVRVSQFAPLPPVPASYSGNYQQSGYRHTNSTLRLGGSVDRTHVVETWGNGGQAFASAWLWHPYDYRFGPQRGMWGGRHDRDRRPGGRPDRFDYGYGGYPYGGYGGYGYGYGGYDHAAGSVYWDNDSAAVEWGHARGGWSEGYGHEFQRGIGPRRVHPVGPHPDDRVVPLESE